MGSLQQVARVPTRKKQLQICFYDEPRVGVIRFKYHADIVGRPLVLAWVQGATSSYLLVVTMDSWILTGSHESPSILLESMKNLDIKRIYAPANSEIWERMDREILSGEIHVRDVEF